MAESSQSVNMDSMIQRFDQMANAVEKALGAIPDSSRCYSVSHEEYHQGFNQEKSKGGHQIVSVLILIRVSNGLLLRISNSNRF